VSILVDKSTRLIVQGITGRDGAFHTRQMIDYGTHVVAGVTPGKGGESVHGVPVFDSVAEAVEATRANASVVYVPAPFAADAIHEAADAGLSLIVCITEGVPVRDTLSAFHKVLAMRGPDALGRPRLIGPNCPGLITPGQCKVGILPGHIVKPGPVGVVSRSGTLTYEVVKQLTDCGLGQTTCLGIGGDPVIGTNFIDALTLFEADPRTGGIVLMGEIGGTDEEEAAQFIKRHVSKPVVAFVAGQTAPPGKRMGHAGAIISGGTGTAAEKIAAFQAAGVPVARIPSEIPRLMSEILERRRARGKSVARNGGARNGGRAAAKAAAGNGRKPARGKVARVAATARGAGAARRGRAGKPARKQGKR
jgi:succinyl-CoA synthetase alpha subunit